MEGSLPETLDRMLPSDKAGEREVPRTRNNSRHPIALRSFTPLASSDETVPCPVQKLSGTAVPPPILPGQVHTRGLVP